MKSIEIKEAALKFFTIHGYEGASLSQIAEEVGLKKQSIYAHFKGKDDLFLQVLRDAKNAELSSMLNFFNEMNTNTPEADLYDFLKMVIEMFQKNEHMKFWLRMSFFPPAHLTEEIGKDVADIDQKVQTELEKKFSEWINTKSIYGKDPRIPTLAFIGVVDTIMMELVYVNDPERLNEKLEALWAVFWRGISLSS